MRFDAGHFWDSPNAFYDAEDAPAPPPTPQPIGNMRNLTRFLINPFTARGISLDELVAFASDHLERMVANNPGGILDARIAATSAALDVLIAMAGSDAIKAGVRRARKAAKNAFRDALLNHARRIQGALETIYGVDSQEVMEAFPFGRSIYSQCTDDSMTFNLSPMTTVVAANAAALPPVIVTLAAGLVPNWTALHAESEAATGAKTATEEEKRNARAALALQLYLTLAKLMELFPNQPDKLPLYMQQHFLEDHPAQEEEEEEPPPTPES